MYNTLNSLPGARQSVVLEVAAMSYLWTWCERDREGQEGATRQAQEVVKVSRIFILTASLFIHSLHSM